MQFQFDKIISVCVCVPPQIASVDKYVGSINSQMQQQHELERLEAIMTKIEPYDAVEAPNDECVKVGHGPLASLYCLLQSFLCHAPN